MVIEAVPAFVGTGLVQEEFEMDRYTLIKHQRPAQMLRASIIFLALGLGAHSPVCATTGEGSERDASPSLFERAKGGVVRGAEAAGNGIQRGASAAAHGIERGVQATGRALERGAQATGRGLRKAAEKIGLADPSPE